MVPQWILKLRMHEQLAHYDGPFAPRALAKEHNRCTACAVADELHCARIPHDDDALFVCRGCMAAWHKACAAAACVPVLGFAPMGFEGCPWCPA